MVEADSGVPPARAATGGAAAPAAEEDTVEAAAAEALVAISTLVLRSHTKRQHLPVLIMWMCNHSKSQATCAGWPRCIHTLLPFLHLSADHVHAQPLQVPGHWRGCSSINPTIQSYVTLIRCIVFPLLLLMKSPNQQPRHSAECPHPKRTWRDADRHIMHSLSTTTSGSKAGAGLVSTSCSSCCRAVERVMRSDLFHLTRSMQTLCTS